MLAPGSELTQSWLFWPFGRKPEVGNLCGPLLAHLPMSSNSVSNKYIVKLIIQFIWKGSDVRQAKILLKRRGGQGTPPIRAGGAVKTLLD